MDKNDLARVAHLISTATQNDMCKIYYCEILLCKYRTVVLFFAWTFKIVCAIDCSAPVWTTWLTQVAMNQQENRAPNTLWYCRILRERYYLKIHPKIQRRINVINILVTLQLPKSELNFGKLLKYGDSLLRLEDWCALGQRQQRLHSSASTRELSITSAHSVFKKQGDCKLFPTKETTKRGLHELWTSWRLNYTCIVWSVRKENIT